MSLPSEANVILYTDGACSGNPGPGGWGFLLRHPASGKEVQGSGGDPHTTNNQMELTAVIEGLSLLKRPTVVEIVSDSTYVLNGLSSWIEAWKKRNWQRKGGPLKNVDLWKKLDSFKQIHTLSFRWIKGHAGHPENEICDQLAVEAYQKYLKHNS
ncbi:MAG: ribonuclease HI [Planctomycetia bacterium]|nr:ribonuclease HI [Planctomycetia bacterium]